MKGTGWTGSLEQGSGQCVGPGWHLLESIERGAACNETGMKERLYDLTVPSGYQKEWQAACPAASKIRSRINMGVEATYAA